MMMICDAAEALVTDPGAVCGAVTLYLPEADSTQNVARALLRQGAIAGTAVLAGYQTAGRGTQGRSWISPPGAGLHLSVAVPVPTKPEAIPWLTPTAAIAATQALRGLTTVPPRLKWPNDILLSGAKVGGVLTEIPAGSALAVIGIGLNIHSAPKLDGDAPKSAERHELLLSDGGSASGRPPAARATCLGDWSLHPVERNELAARVLRELDHLLARLLAGRLDHVKEAWRLLLETVGGRVTVEQDGQTVVGRATAVDGSGALIVRPDAGGTIRVAAGSGAVIRHTV